MEPTRSVCSEGLRSTPMAGRFPARRVRMMASPRWPALPVTTIDMSFPRAKVCPSGQNGTMASPHRVEIRTARESDAESIRAVVKAIAAEKWYLATLDGFSLDENRAFLRRIEEGNLLQVTAFAEDQVVGFCDISPNPAPGFMHVGRLGMGVLLEWRRHGVGRRLLQACLGLAKNAGLEKVELEVFSDNTTAIRLYESFGFSREGVRVRSRKLEGRYQDLMLMALWL